MLFNTTFLTVVFKVANNLFSASDPNGIGYKLTEGQASTCLLAKKYLDEGDQLIIGACDNEMIYDLHSHNEILKRNDALIWTFRKNISVLSNPKMYGWV